MEKPAGYHQPFRTDFMYALNRINSMKDKRLYVALSTRMRSLTEGSKKQPVIPFPLLSGLELKADDHELLKEPVVV